MTSSLAVVEAAAEPGREAAEAVSNSRHRPGCGCLGVVSADLS